MNGRIVVIGHMSTKEVEAWRDLARRAAEPNPVFEAECLIPAARNLPLGGKMLLVIAEEEGEFFGCFPVMDVEGGLPPHFKIPFLRRRALTTQVRRVPYDGTPLIRGDRGVEAVESMFAALATRESRASRGGLLVLESLDIDGPVANFIEEGAAKLGLKTFTLLTWNRPLVRRRAESTYRIDNVDDGVSDRKIARMRRQLGEKLGGEVVVVDRSDETRAVDALIELESSGYKSKIGTALASHPGEAQWFREMCSLFRDEGRLLVYSLQVGQREIAMQLMLRAGEGIFGIQVAYDEEFAKYSPGIQLHLGLFERFHEDTDAMWHDTCTFAENQTLLRLYPDRRTISILVVATGGLMDRFVLFAYSLVAKSIHHGPESVGDPGRLKRLMGRAVKKLGLLPK